MTGVDARITTRAESSQGVAFLSAFGREFLSGGAWGRQTPGKQNPAQRQPSGASYFQSAGPHEPSGMFGETQNGLSMSPRLTSRSGASEPIAIRCAPPGREGSAFKPSQDHGRASPHT